MPCAKACGYHKVGGFSVRPLIEPKVHTETQTKHLFKTSQAWWHVLIMPTLMQKDLKFDASLGYTANSCLKNQNNKVNAHTVRDRLKATEP